MVIQLKMFGGLAEYLPEKSIPYPAEGADGSTVGELLDTFSVPRDKPRILLVNSRHANLDHVLQDGDVVAVFPPVAGG